MNGLLSTGRCRCGTTDGSRRLPRNGGGTVELKLQRPRDIGNDGDVQDIVDGMARTLGRRRGYSSREQSFMCLHDPATQNLRPSKAVCMARTA